MSALLCLWFAPALLPLIAACLPSFDGRKRVTFRKSNGQRVTFYKLVTSAPRRVRMPDMVST